MAENIQRVIPPLILGTSQVQPCSPPPPEPFQNSLVWMPLIALGRLLKCCKWQWVRGWCRIPQCAHSSYVPHSFLRRTPAGSPCLELLAFPKRGGFTIGRQTKATPWGVSSENVPQKSIFGGGFFFLVGGGLPFLMRRGPDHTLLKLLHSGGVLC